MPTIKTKDGTEVYWAVVSRSFSAMAGLSLLPCVRRPDVSDDDQIVPIQASALLSSKLIKGAHLKVYPGAPHGMCTTLKNLNADLLGFIQG